MLPSRSVFRRPLRSAGPARRHPRDVADPADVLERARAIRDGEQGLTLIRDLAEDEQRRPDLILLDYNLPKIHGGALAEAVCTDARLSSAPTVLLSNSTPPAGAPAMPEGLLFRVKPARYQELLVLVNELLALPDGRC